MCLILWCGWRL